MLINAYEGSKNLSSATKGFEREIFVHNILEQVFPPSYRFGSGDIIDGYGNKSGQADIVIEYPNFMSFPYIEIGPRLYLAEGIAAIIEVKSDVQNQWNEVIETGKMIKKLKRIFVPDRDREMEPLLGKGPKHDIVSYSSIIINEKYPPKDIPYFVVGYNGWKQKETLSQKVNESRDIINGILVIDPLMYQSNNGASSEGDVSLLQFIDGIFYFIQKIFMQVPVMDIYHTPRDFYTEMAKVKF